MKPRQSIAGALLALAAWGACASVLAQEGDKAAPRPDKPAGAAPDEQAARPGTVQPAPPAKAAVQGAAPARPTRLHPRRHVWQDVGPSPTVNLGPVYSPTLTPRPPAALGTPGVGSGPVPAPLPPGPAPLNSCVGNLCTDAGGGQYNVGTGNAGVNSQGRLCNRVGTTMQCF